MHEKEQIMVGWESR